MEFTLFLINAFVVRQNKEVAMERSKIKLYAQKAYELHIHQPTLSLTQKSNRFARFFAYEIASSIFEQHGEIASCIAAQYQLSFAANDYAYACHRERALAQLKASHAEYKRAIGITNADFEIEWTGITPKTCDQSGPDPDIIHAEHTFFNQNLAALNHAKTAYLKAYCTAFLLFDSATQTHTQQNSFEVYIEKNLNASFGDPYTYLNALSQFMMRTEISMLMTIILIIGLLGFALATSGFSMLSATSTY